MHFGEVLEKVDEQPLPHEACAELCGSDHANDGVREDLAEQGAERQGLLVRRGRGVVSVALLLVLVRVKAAVARVEVLLPSGRRSVAHEQKVHDEHPEQRHRRDEKHPVPGQLRDDHAADREREPVARRDHHAEDPAEHSALADVKPRRVDLHHREGAEGLKIHVDRVQDAQPEHDVLLPAREEQQADHAVERGCPERADQDGPAAADAIGERAVDDDAQRVDPEAYGEDHAHLGFIQMKRAPEGALGRREVVAAHVQRRVRQPQRKPIREPPQTIRRRVLWRFVMFDRALSHVLRRQRYTVLIPSALQ